MNLTSCNTANILVRRDPSGSFTTTDDTFVGSANSISINDGPAGYISGFYTMWPTFSPPTIFETNVEITRDLHIGKNVKVTNDLFVGCNENDYNNDNGNTSGLSGEVSVLGLFNRFQQVENRLKSLEHLVVSTTMSLYFYRDIELLITSYMI